MNKGHRQARQGQVFEYSLIRAKTRYDIDGSCQTGIRSEIGTLFAIRQKYL